MLLSFSQKVKYSEQEMNYIHVLDNFKQYLSRSIKDRVSLADSEQLSFIAEHFLFLNIKPDSAKGKKIDLATLNSLQLNALRQNLNDLYNYFKNDSSTKLLENLEATPVRLSANKFIYTKLSAFQKDNTMEICDRRNPTRILFYILFIPALNNINPAPKIWSWVMVFKLDKILFRSATGEEGYEYLFNMH